MRILQRNLIWHDVLQSKEHQALCPNVSAAKIGLARSLSSFSNIGSQAVRHVPPIGTSDERKCFSWHIEAKLLEAKRGPSPRTAKCFFIFAQPGFLEAQQRARRSSHFRATKRKLEEMRDAPIEAFWQASLPAPAQSVCTSGTISQNTAKSSTHLRRYLFLNYDSRVK